MSSGEVARGLVRVRPKHHFHATFELLKGFSFFRSFLYSVESELPVRVWIADDANVEAFRAGQDYECYGGSFLGHRHVRKIRIPVGLWNLVIVNDHPTETAVFYELT
jgi:hypothetical protein